MENVRGTLKKARVPRTHNRPSSLHTDMGGAGQRWKRRENKGRGGTWKEKRVEERRE